MRSSLEQPQREQTGSNWGLRSGKQFRDARGLSLGDAQPPLPPESIISAENPILKTLMYPFVDDFYHENKGFPKQKWGFHMIPSCITN